MKKTMHIFLHSVDDVKNIANIAKEMEGEVTISSGHYCVDAKSILGIFVLNLGVPLNLEIEKWKDEYEGILAPYVV